MRMFDVAAESYDRFMGRYSQLLAHEFADFAHVAGGSALDVGCGPGALTRILVERAERVAAVDPSESFVAAARERFPGVDVQRSTAEQLPFPDDAFDVALAQLVVNFMGDPVGGIREMARVTRPGGTIAACVWDLAGRRSPMSTVWTVLNRFGFEGEGRLPGAYAGSLCDIFVEAGLADVEEGEVVAERQHASFDEWWEPFTHGVGPVGQALASLDPGQREEVVAETRAAVGEPPIRIRAVAWAARGRVG
ncbi:MAG TPA: class I SAM-dependent methyltransferase [Gaiellaceae bacterium]|nr:class I SAM-dependent methyltransferase [Gaiellaceae bacterium]